MKAPTQPDDLSETELAILGVVQRFVAERVRPHVAELERASSYPQHLVDQMAEMGLFGIAVPEEHGGLGLRLPVLVRVLELLASGWTTLAGFLNSHCTVAYLLATHGTPEQRRAYLPSLASGQRRGALCLTEPDAGSDLQAIRTVARAGPDGQLVVSGTKIYVTNGARASVLAVLARTDPQADPPKRGISLLILDDERDGIRRGATFSKMAYGHVDTVEISLAELRVPATAILGGRPGEGMRQLLDGLEVGRLSIAASAIGLAAAALSEARAFAAVRRAFGTTIDQHQAIQLRVAEMATRLAAARCLTLEAARYKQAHGRADMACGMAKLYASEACLEIVGHALRIHGGHGYIKDCAVERLYREAPLYVVGEGTNDIQKLLIARRLQSGAEDGFLGLPT